MAEDQGLAVPEDVCQIIIALLSVREVCSLGSCSRQWHALCSSNFVWYVLYKKRWCIKNSDRSLDSSIKPTCDGSAAGKISTACKGWRMKYICEHKKMAAGAASVIAYIKERACYDSVEVADYQKAMSILSSIGLEFQDVEIFLLVPKLSVLINLLGLHYCLVHLKTKGEDARKALIRNKVGERHVCLRWWSLGGWVNGFRRHDEMHMRNASLFSLTQLELHSFLEVIDRGTLHEVLRVQISADFESSAWVARSMHSQR